MTTSRPFLLNESEFTMKSTVESYIWTEKYRPQSIDECILPNSIKTELNAFVSSGQIGNVIFSGQAGVGKTTVARAIARQLDADMLFLNLSSENGIDVVRNQITQFASTASFDGNLKVVLGDECLSEHEKVRIGTVDNWKAVPLNELKRDTRYPIVSFNIEKEIFEDDTGYIVSDREDELCEVIFESGKKVVSNPKHPFMCIVGGEIVQRTIEDGLIDHRVVVQACDSFGYDFVDDVRHIGRGRVINLTVEKNHTFITENGIVTHNCDRMSPSAQDAAKATMETFHKSTRFILTTNNIHKIIDPIKSRCTLFEFKIPDEEKKDLMAQMMKRCVEICRLENIEYDPKAIVALVQNNFPDFRKTLNELQRYSTYGKIDSGILVAESTSYDDLVKAMKDKKFADVRKWIAKNADIDSSELFRYFYDNILVLFEGKSIPNVILILAQYQDSASRVVDQEINNIACVLEIMSVAQWK